LRYRGDWDDDICAENNQAYLGYDMAPLPQTGKPDF